MAVLEKNILISLAEDAVKAALKLGAAEAEAYVYEGQATNIGIDLGQISKTNRIIDRGLGIRVAANKAIGFAYTNILDDAKAIENVVSSALSAARQASLTLTGMDFHKRNPISPQRRHLTKKSLTSAPKTC